MSVLQNLATFFRYLNMSPDAIGQELEQNEKNRYKQEGRDLLTSFINKNKTDNDRANSSVNAISKTPNLDKMNQMSYVNKMPIPENQNGGIYSRDAMENERTYANRMTATEPAKPQESDVGSLLPYSDDPAVINGINLIRDRDKTKFSEYENQRNQYETGLSNAEKEYKFNQAIEDFKNTLTPDQLENPAFKSLLVLAKMGDHEGASKMLSNQISDIGKEVYANKDRYKYDSDLENLKSQNTIKEKGVQFNYDKTLKGMDKKADSSLIDLPGFKPLSNVAITETSVKEMKKSVPNIIQMETLLHEYKNLYDKVGVTLTGDDASKLQALARNIQLIAKSPEFYNLGVLNGPDLEVLEGAIPDASKIKTGMRRQYLGNDVSNKLTILKNTIDVKSEAFYKINGFEREQTAYGSGDVFLQGDKAKRLAELRAKIKGGR